MSDLKNWEIYSSGSEDTENSHSQINNKNSNNLKVYNTKELEYLNRYLPIAKNGYDESELYDIIVENHFNDEKIKNKLLDRLKYLSAKGDQYGWKVVGKSKRKHSDNSENLNKGGDKRKINNQDRYKEKNNVEGREKYSNNYNNEYYEFPENNYNLKVYKRKNNVYKNDNENYYDNQFYYTCKDNNNEYNLNKNDKYQDDKEYNNENQTNYMDTLKNTYSSQYSKSKNNYYKNKYYYNHNYYNKDYYNDKNYGPKNNKKIQTYYNYEQTMDFDVSIQTNNIDNTAIELKEEKENNIKNQLNQEQIEFIDKKENHKDQEYLDNKNSILKPFSKESDLISSSLQNKEKTVIFKNNFNLQTKNETGNNFMNSDNTQRRKNDSLHIKSDFFEINMKSTPSSSYSKTQFLDHLKSKDNILIYNLYFSIYSSNFKESMKNCKSNNFEIESSSIIMNSNNSSINKEEILISKDKQQPNECISQPNPNQYKNKFNQYRNHSNPNYSNMYNDTSYLNNQQAFLQNQNIYYEVPQYMNNTAFYPLTPISPMPYTCYPFTYDQNMINMQNTIDPFMMNMYYQFLQNQNFQSNIYKNIRNKK